MIISSGHPKLTSRVSVRSLNEISVGFLRAILDIPSHHRESADDNWEKTIDIIDASWLIREGSYVVSIGLPTDEILADESEAETTSLSA